MPPHRRLSAARPSLKKNTAPGETPCGAAGEKELYDI
jgi:hypothetical protein